MPLQSNAIKCNTRKSLKIFQDFNKRKSPSVLLLQSKLGNSFLNYAQQSLKLALVPIQPPIYPSSHQKLNFSLQMVISNSPSPPPPFTILTYVQIIYLGFKISLPPHCRVLETSLFIIKVAVGGLYSFILHPTQYYAPV